MNSDHLCERCNQEVAQCLVEHATYAEAICLLCRDDEKSFYDGSYEVDGDRYLYE